MVLLACSVISVFLFLELLPVLSETHFPWSDACVRATPKIQIQLLCCGSQNVRAFDLNLWLHGRFQHQESLLGIVFATSTTSVAENGRSPLTMELYTFWTV